MKILFGAALIAAMASAYGVQDDYIHGYLDKHHEPEIFAVFRQTDDEMDGFDSHHDPYNAQATHQWVPLEAYSPHMYDYVEHHYQDFEHEGRDYGYHPYVDQPYDSHYLYQKQQEPQQDVEIKAQVTYEETGR